MPFDPSKLHPAEYEAGSEAYRRGASIYDNPVRKPRRLAHEAWLMGFVDAQKAERGMVDKMIREHQLEAYDMLREAVTLARNEQLTSWAQVRQRLAERNPAPADLTIIEAAGQLWRDSAAIEGIKQ